jgi:hypothetical protein
VGLKIKKHLIYVITKFIRSGVAPNIFTIGRMKAKEVTLIIIDKRANNLTDKLKIYLAPLFSPIPFLYEMSTPAPTETSILSDNSISKTGTPTVTAAKASLPNILATRRPSTTIYKELKIRPATPGIM